MNVAYRSESGAWMKQRFTVDGDSLVPVGEPIKSATTQDESPEQHQWAGVAWEGKPLPTGS